MFFWGHEMFYMNTCGGLACLSVPLVLGYTCLQVTLWVIGLYPRPLQEQQLQLGGGGAHL